VRSRVYLLLEYAPNGNLFWYIRKQKALPESRAIEIFKQTCDAIRYMHQKGFIHRDLKPENILLDENFDVKVCDFGWCTEYEHEDEMRKTFCGTYEYMAPEIFEKRPYDEKIDIWALGVLLYELVQGKSPFRGSTVIDIYKNVQRGEIRYSRECSSDLRDLVSKILQRAPEKRVSMAEIFAHPLMRSKEQSLTKPTAHTHSSHDKTQTPNTQKVSSSPKVNAFASYFLSKGSEERKKSQDKEDSVYMNRTHVNPIVHALQNVTFKDHKHPLGHLIPSSIKHQHSDSLPLSRHVHSSKSGVDRSELPGCEYLITQGCSKPLGQKRSFIPEGINQSSTDSANMPCPPFKPSQTQTFGQTISTTQSPAAPAEFYPAPTGSDKYYLDLNLRKNKRENVKSLSRTAPKHKINTNCRTFDEGEQPIEKRPPESAGSKKPNTPIAVHNIQPDKLFHHPENQDSKPSKGGSNEIRTWLEHKKQSLFGLELPREKSDNGLIRNLISRKMTEARRMNKENSKPHPDNTVHVANHSVQTQLRNIPSDVNVGMTEKRSSKDPSDYTYPHQSSPLEAHPSNHISKQKNKITVCRELLDKISVCYCFT